MIRIKIFLDTANILELQQAMSAGVLDGCTTNPSLIKAEVDKVKKEGLKIDLEGHIEQICRTLGKGKSVSLEVFSTDYENMVKEGEFLYKRFNPAAGNVAVKIPINPSVDGEDNSHGIRAIKYLSSKGIPINTTLIMTPEQALLAAKAGASIVSPFAGRIDDHIRVKTGVKFGKEDYFPAGGIGKDDNGIVSGIDLVKKIVEIFKNYKIKTEVLAGSIRNERQAREVALAGADIATIPFSVLMKMLQHEKTLEGTIKFSQDTVQEYKNVFRNAKK